MTVLDRIQLMATGVQAKNCVDSKVDTYTSRTIVQGNTIQTLG